MVSVPYDPSGTIIYYDKDKITDNSLGNNLWSLVLSTLGLFSLACLILLLSLLEQRQSAHVLLDDLEGSLHVLLSESVLTQDPKSHSDHQVRPDVLKAVAYLLKYRLSVLWVHLYHFSDKEDSLKGGES